MADHRKRTIVIENVAPVVDCGRYPAKREVGAVVEVTADIFRALRPGGRLMIIDFEPGGILNWISRSETGERHGGHGTPKETVLQEVTGASFQVMRGPESWRGRTYAVLFRRP